MDFPVCPRVASALQRRAKHPSFGYTYQPEALWKAVADWYSEHHQWSIEVTSFVFSPSAVASASFCVRAFSEPNDSVMVMTPLYGPLQKAVTQEGRRLVRHSLQSKEHVYTINFESFEEDIVRERVRLLILCNPHNPGSRVWSKTELLRVVGICRQHQVLIISDDIHADW